MTVLGKQLQRYHHNYSSALTLGLCALALVVIGGGRVLADGLLQSGWSFRKGDLAEAVAADVSSWQNVDLPHTWNAVDALNGGGAEPPGDPGYHRGPAWYAKSFATDPAWKDRRVFLRFEGVSSYAQVFLNGSKLGEHKGAFTAFVFEITDALKPDGMNELRVRDDNTLRPDIPPLSGDFPVFGGIYRPVAVLTKPIACISPLDHASPGVRVFQREVSSSKAVVEVVTSIDHFSAQSTSAKVSVRLLDGDQVVASVTSSGIDLAAKAKADCSLELTIDHPHLWNGRKDPHIYQVEVSLQAASGQVDRVIQPLGLRFYRVDPKKGFFLNGEPYMLRGVARHQDRAGKGWAVSSADLKEDVDLIVEMGARAVRLAHYPHAEEFYRLCDEAGLLVWAEIPVVDKISTDPGFGPNAKQQLVEMIRQLGNHPSVFAWGLSNELFHRPTPNAIPLMVELNELAKREDSTRPTTIAVNKMRPKLCKITDLLGFNGYPGWYGGGPSGMEGMLKSYQKIGGERGVGVSEYGAGASIQHHAQNPQQPKPTSKWHPEEWQAIVHEENWRCIRDADYCWGSFIWNMFDFASVWRDEGDAPGMNDKGIVTYDRKIRKDAFYFYKANWSEEPVLHLTSKRHTGRNESTTPVKVYTNASEVSLLVNGKMISSLKPDDLHIVRWDEITLVPGANQIEVRAQVGGQSLKDRAVWTLSP